MSTQNKAQTAEERNVIVAEMTRCIAMASHVWAFISDKPLTELVEGIRCSGIDIQDVVRVIRQTWSAPLTDERVHAIGHSLAASISEYNLTTCGLWDFAHALHHCLYDTDLPRHSG